MNYNYKTHIEDLISSDYYKNLFILRNIVEKTCDEYFGELQATKIDLFMITNGVSSPMGKGSDSLPIEIKFGKDNCYLVDSAQFGFEPLVQKSFELVYCFMPSFRGEDPDKRHLNQFFHCEAEVRGSINDILKISENLIKYIFRNVYDAYKRKVFVFKKHNFDYIPNLIKEQFPQITFDQAEEILNKNGLGNLVEKHDFGRNISREGEVRIAEIVGKSLRPVWIKNYDRDVVAFYQKPNPKNKESVLNGDLIFPSINGALGGEFIGMGQRQDSREEMLESMKRQGIRGIHNYDWYLNLRKRKDYKTTSGFGLGIERLLAFMLAKDNIIDVIAYPVLKNKPSYFK